MISDESQKKLQHIVRGTLLEGQEDYCTAIRNLLCQSFGTNTTIKGEFESRTILKKEQTSFLKSYSFLGFTENSDKNLCVILEQPFIQGGQAELNAIKELLTFNGFVNVKRQDYYNEALGLLLEDMHDENVIAKDDVLFFIDTVFYVMEKK